MNLSKISKSTVLPIGTPLPFESCNDVKFGWNFLIEVSQILSFWPLTKFTCKEVGGPVWGYALFGTYGKDKESRGKFKGKFSVHKPIFVDLFCLFPLKTKRRKGSFFFFPLPFLSFPWVPNKP